jgi:Ca2+-transporting ATPase
VNTGVSSATTSRATAECALEDVYARLQTSGRGLTTKESSRRILKFGPNLLPTQRKQLFYQKMLVQLRNLFNVLLIIAAVLSFVAGYTANDMSSVNMGLAIVAAVIISMLFAVLQERRAERAVEAIKQLVPQNAKVLRDGHVKAVSVSDVVPGDVLELEEGDKVPADARVFESYELSVDNSTLTGEAEPQHRTSERETGSPNAGLISCSNMVFAGTTVASGSGKAVVLATGANTEFGRAVALSQEVEEPLSPLQKELDRTAKLNLALSVIVGFIFLLFALTVIGLELSESIMFMIGVMVSLVPEGLQVTLTLALAISSLEMSKRNVIVKRLSSVETLGSTTVICTDKTGTITEGQMTVRLVWAGGRTFQVTGEGYEPLGSVMFEGRKLTVQENEELSALCEVGALDNNATLVPPLDRQHSRWTALGDSTDAALLVLAAKSGIRLKELQTQKPRVGLIPFESARKMMSSIHRDSSGKIIACVKGAPHEVLASCSGISLKGASVPMTDTHRSQVKGQIDGFARDAYRVLALASRELPGEQERYESGSVESGLTFLGLVAILDPPRAETAEAVRKARSAGVRIVMLTGDHKLTAEAIARKVGIVTGPKGTVLTGDELSALSEERLSKVLDSPELVFARIAPEQKLRVVRALRAKGETVAVTGDGVNDAPALLEADIGIAMGLSGTDVARESADMVLMDDNFASIVSGMEQGRAVFDNLKKFIVYVYAHNWAELLTFIAFVLLRTPLPLAVVQVLAIDLVLEIPPSLTITMEPPEPGIMERPPRSRRSRLFDIGALARSAYIGILIGLAALLLCFRSWAEAGWSLGMSSVGNNSVYIEGTTVVTAAIMAGQLGTLIATRTNVKSAFSVSPMRNKWLLVAICVELMLLVAIVYLPPFQMLFTTGSLEPLDWLLIYSFFPLIILFEEGRKLVLRTFVLGPLPSAGTPVPSDAMMVANGSGNGTAANFLEKAPPVILAQFLDPREDSAVQFAMTFARKAGSRVVALKSTIGSGKAADGAQCVLGRFESSGVPCELIDVPEPRRAPDEKAVTKAIEEAIKETHAKTLIIPVARSTLVGGMRALKKLSWVRNFPDRRLLLVSGPKAVNEGSAKRPLSILIPVLREFRQGPFDVARILTAGSMFPDVDVVAAKVVEINRSNLMYSFYRRESLAIEDRQFEFLRTHLSRRMARLIHPFVLLARNVGGDISRFAKEKNVDLILMQAAPDGEGGGILSKVERDIAAKAPCTVVVVLGPSHDEND